MGSFLDGKLSRIGLFWLELGLVRVYPEWTNVLLGSCPEFGLVLVGTCSKWGVILVEGWSSQELSRVGMSWWVVISNGGGGSGWGFAL